MVALIAWVTAFFTGGYMLPWAIAATRGLRNTPTIGWFNLFFGWTIIGWVWALFVALRKED